MKNCPCNLQKSYLRCCSIYLSGKVKAPTQFNMQAAMQDFNDIKWQRLEVLRSQESENSGVVEFKAYFQYQGHPHVLHEISYFERENEEWFYVEALSHDK